MIIRIAAASVAIAVSSVAYAANGPAQIPEAGDAALFTLAVAALVIGRQASKRPPSAK